MRYIPLWGLENQRYWEGEYPPRTANNIGKSARIRYLSEITHRGTRLVIAFAVCVRTERPCVSSSRCFGMNTHTIWDQQGVGGEGL